MLNMTLEGHGRIGAHPMRGPLSDFERSYAQGTAPFTDFNAFGSLNPITKEWVARSIAGTVTLNNRGGIPYRHGHTTVLPEEITAFDPGNLETNIIPADPTIPTDYPAERVLSIFMHPHFRRGNLDARRPYADYLTRQIDSRTKKAYPVNLVLPAMAFKDQNPLNTQHSVSYIDLGEYLAMAQMRDLVNSVRAEYPPDLRVIIAQDGATYADLFGGGDAEGALEYGRRLRRVRDELGLRGRVEIVDISWLTMRDPRFAGTRKQIKGLVRDLYEEDETFRLQIDALSRGMFWNIPHPGHTMDQVASLANTLQEPGEEGLKHVLHEKAVDYAAVLLAIAHTDVFSRAYPDALRGTVHPKKRAPQVPLNLVNNSCSVFPYNGVPVVSRRQLEAGRTLRQASRIIRYHQVQDEPGATTVFATGRPEAFFYKVDGGCSEGNRQSK